jgi:hypothetical protein
LERCNMDQQFNDAFRVAQQAAAEAAAATGAAKP